MEKDVLPAATGGNAGIEKSLMAWLDHFSNNKKIANTMKNVIGTAISIERFSRMTVQASEALEANGDDYLVPMIYPSVCPAYFF
jgi:hypothetical protein